MRKFLLLLNFFLSILFFLAITPSVKDSVLSQNGSCQIVNNKNGKKYFFPNGTKICALNEEFDPEDFANFSVLGYPNYSSTLTYEYFTSGISLKSFCYDLKNNNNSNRKCDEIPPIENVTVVANNLDLLQRAYYECNGSKWERKFLEGEEICVTTNEGNTKKLTVSDIFPDSNDTIRKLTISGVNRGDIAKKSPGVINENIICPIEINLSLDNNNQSSSMVNLLKGGEYYCLNIGTEGGRVYYCSDKGHKIKDENKIAELKSKIGKQTNENISFYEPEIKLNCYNYADKNYNPKPFCKPSGLGNNLNSFQCTDEFKLSKEQLEFKKLNQVDLPGINCGLGEVTDESKRCCLPPPEGYDITKQIEDFTRNQCLIDTDLGILGHVRLICYDSLLSFIVGPLSNMQNQMNALIKKRALVNIGNYCVDGIAAIPLSSTQYNYDCQQNFPPPNSNLFCGKDKNLYQKLTPSNSSDISKCLCVIPNFKDKKMCLDFIFDNKDQSKCLECQEGSIFTAFGCVPYTKAGFIKDFIFTRLIGLGGLVALTCIIYSAFVLQISQGNPEKIKKTQELITSCISGLMLIIFSVFILKLIGIDILKIPGFK